MTTAAKQLRAEADRAEEVFAENKAKLYRKDGSKLYSDDEHERRVKDLQKEKIRTFDSISERANEERLKAEAEAAKNDDLSAKLSTEELQNASARYAFISEEVSEMAEGALLSRLSGVLEGTDRASMFAHARAARKRGAEEYKRRVEAARKAGRTESYVVRNTALEEAAERLEDKLCGESRKERIEAAQERANGYVGVQINIGARKHPYTPNHSRPGNISGVPNVG